MLRKKETNKSKDRKQKLPPLPSFSQIFKQAWVFLKKNFQVLFLAALILNLPIVLVDELVVNKISQEVEKGNINLEEVEFYSYQEILEKFYGTEVFRIILFTVILGVLVSLLESLIGIYAVKQATGNKKLELKELFGGLFKQFFPFLGVTILVFLTILGGLLLLVVPGVIFGVWFSLAPMVLIFEGVGGVTALKKSKFLVKGYFKKVLGYSILIGIIIGAINGFISAFQNVSFGFLVLFFEAVAALALMFEFIFITYLYLEIKKAKEKTGNLSV